ncbi:hypothetical protein SFHH103_02140 [Sinorhizobium fredii HH103]|uniref:Uncharacterized protein n=1 Tax=Sinorhizobium fredii (strain HH103) TaxID=1117943 RepID=G9A8Q5_SINF1|nr:hypothetical protein SFHH103_02140 [Sinorhizobium fredii HH103]
MLQVKFDQNGFIGGVSAYRFLPKDIPSDALLRCEKLGLGFHVKTLADQHQAGKGNHGDDRHDDRFGG